VKPSPISKGYNCNSSTEHGLRLSTAHDKTTAYREACHAVVEDCEVPNMNRYLLVTLVTFVLFVVLGIYSLNRGIYIGSASYINGNLLRKNCKYLFVTGISRQPAHGGVLDQSVPLARGIQLASEPDSLYCRLFAE
jgi:hypothetical protein